MSLLYNNLEDFILIDEKKIMRIEGILEIESFCSSS